MHKQLLVAVDGAFVWTRSHPLPPEKRSSKSGPALLGQLLGRELGRAERGQLQPQTRPASARAAVYGPEARLHAKVVAELGSRDDAPMRDLEVRIPRQQADVGPPGVADQNQTSLRSASARRADEPEQPRSDDLDAGFLMHLPPERVLPRVPVCRPATRPAPDHGVGADQNDALIGGDAEGVLPVRPTVGHRGRWMPRDDPRVTALRQDGKLLVIRGHRSVEGRPGDGLALRLPRGGTREARRQTIPAQYWVASMSRTCPIRSPVYTV
jgi:hypothetical protein